ncbi:MAG: GNAT family N-acetyltransferase [Burkholderiales bacterium]
MTVTVRIATPSDVDAVLALWREADAEPTHTDNAESIDQLVAYDPGALLVAVASDQIVGSIIAGWDGWRGSAYRLVVAASHRRQGLGRRLVREAEDRLAKLAPFGTKRLS